MNWSKLQAAGIRFFWATVFPALGWFAVGANLEGIGVPPEAAIIGGAAIGGLIYGVKKYVWPDTKW